MLCTPTVCYVPLTRSVFTPQRAFIGIEASLAYAQLVRQQLPGFQVERGVIFQHAQGLMARYSVSWQGEDGQRHTIANSALCRFRGERLSQIGASQPVHRFRKLLEAPQKPTNT